MIQRASLRYWISGTALAAVALSLTSEFTPPSAFDHTATETTAAAGMWVSARTPGIGPHLLSQERLELVASTGSLSSADRGFHAEGDHSGHTHNDAFQLDEGKPPEKASIAEEDSARTTDSRMQAKKEENGDDIDDGDENDGDESILDNDGDTNSGLLAFALYEESSEVGYHPNRTVKNLEEEISDSDMPRSTKIAAREILSRAAAHNSDAEYTRVIFRQVGEILNRSWASPLQAGRTILILPAARAVA